MENKIERVMQVIERDGLICNSRYRSYLDKRSFIYAMLHKDGFSLVEIGKIFKKNTGLKTGLKESVNEGKGVDKIMKMADDYSYGKIAGKTVDVMTAKLFQAVYKKASQKARDRVDKMNEKQLYIFMMNLWKKFGKGLSGQMMN